MQEMCFILLFLGHVGWGISWYINGLLIPELNVVRGKTYTFVVEGGSDPEVSAKYHPFYITDDSVGGYAYKTDEEKEVFELITNSLVFYSNSFRLFVSLPVVKKERMVRSFQQVLVVFATGHTLVIPMLKISNHLGRIKGRWN